MFRRVTRTGAVSSPLTAQSVVLIVKRRVEAAGLDPAAFAGHSLPSGFATRRRVTGIGRPKSPTSPATATNASSTATSKPSKGPNTSPECCSTHEEHTTPCSTSSPTPSYNGIPVAGPARSGAVFAPAGTPDGAPRFSTDDGWQVHVSRGDVVAAGPSLPSYSIALTAALAAVQKALDVFSARGDGDLSTVDTANTHIVGWDDDGSTVLRLVSTDAFQASVRGRRRLRSPMRMGDHGRRSRPWRRGTRACGFTARRNLPTTSSIPSAACGLPLA